mgnify:CR=1 FL=1
MFWWCLCCVLWPWLYRSSGRAGRLQSARPLIGWARSQARPWLVLDGRTDWWLTFPVRLELALAGSGAGLSCPQSAILIWAVIKTTIHKRLSDIRVITQWYLIHLLITQIHSWLISFVIIIVKGSEDYFDNNLRQSGVHKARQQLQLAGDFSRERWAVDTRVSLFGQLPLFFVHLIKTKLVKMQKESSSISCVVIRVLGPSLAWAAWQRWSCSDHSTGLAWPGDTQGRQGPGISHHVLAHYSIGFVHRKTAFLFSSSINAIAKMPKALSLPNKHIS